MSSDRVPESRPFRATAIALLLATSLVACGGGSSSGHGPFVPAPIACDWASVSSPDGFAIGMCASTATGVFVDVGNAVTMPLPTDSYNLTLDFPTALDSNDGSTAFTSANLTPPEWGRNLLGALQGISYEMPLDRDLKSPYAALTDFHGAAGYLYGPPWLPPQLEYVRFGTWEKVPTGNEGFVGPWYARTSGIVKNFWPLGSVDRVYRGYVAGAIGPDVDGSPYLQRLRSYSAPIEVVVDGNGRVVSAGLGTIVMPYYDANAQPGFEALAVDPLRLLPSMTDVPDGVLTGSVVSAAGPDADVVDGRFEAHYFGPAARRGHELAGRLRLRTSNGLVAIGAFGAQFVPAVP